MKALLFLKPSLSTEIMKDYGVQMAGYCEGSCKIKFGGLISSIEEAYERVSSLEESLLVDRNLRYQSSI